MSGDPWGDTENDLFAGGAISDNPLAGARTAPQRWWQQRQGILALAASLVSVVALVVVLAGIDGYVMVGVAAGGYLLAVLADVEARRVRYNNKNYVRPKFMGIPWLRVVTFALAVWVAWLVASSLAGTT